MRDELSESAIRLAIILACLLLGIGLLGGLIVLGLELKTKFKASRLPQNIRMKIGFSLLAVGVLCLISVSLWSERAALLKIVALWFLISSIAVLTVRLWRKHLRTKLIRTVDLTSYTAEIIDPDKLVHSTAYIGKSMLDHCGVALDEKERAMHVLVSGSTGSGKTTALKALFLDAALKGQPVLIIDPKGNNLTIDEMKSMFVEAGRNKKDFKVFSIMSPHTSARYNPLSRGTSMQVRDRIMGAMEWSEPFYKHQASSWLGGMIDILMALNQPITIRKLRTLLSEVKALEEIEDLIAAHKDKIKAKELLSRLKATIKGSRENLEGLTSQLRDLDNLDFGNLFDPNGENPEIDFESVVRNKEVAYFQLNTMAYQSAAQVIGRLILQDLKALASQIHGGQIKMEGTFFPIFVDEFGSFAFQGFIDFLKMARDVKFANHLFFQSLADLDAVSPEFKSQVQQNCLTKLILRTDDPTEVDFWSGVAGTVDTVESSYQIENVLGFRMKTGQGNMRYTKQMRVEHDVFKKLSVGQAVLIQKSPAREDLVHLWQPRIRKLKTSSKA